MDFRCAFAVREKHMDLIRLRNQVLWVVLPLAAGGGAMALSDWLKLEVTPVPALVAVFPTLYLVYRLSLWRCPCCRWDIEHDVGRHCPCCGQKSLEHTMGPRCKACGIVLQWDWQRRVCRRHFTIHACSVCGLWLSDEGLGPEKSAM